MANVNTSQNCAQERSSLLVNSSQEEIEVNNPSQTAGKEGNRYAGKKGRITATAIKKETTKQNDSGMVTGVISSPPVGATNSTSWQNPGTNLMGSPFHQQFISKSQLQLTHQQMQYQHQYHQQHLQWQQQLQLYHHRSQAPGEAAYLAPLGVQLPPTGCNNGLQEADVSAIGSPPKVLNVILSPVTKDGPLLKNRASCLTSTPVADSSRLGVNFTNFGDAVTQSATTPVTTSSTAVTNMMPTTTVITTTAVTSAVQYCSEITPTSVVSASSGVTTTTTITKTTISMDEVIGETKRKSCESDRVETGGTPKRSKVETSTNTSMQQSDTSSETLMQ